MARIAIIGTGYVGLTTGVCFAEMGHSVCCIDIDTGKVERLRAGEMPIYEPGLHEVMHRNVAAGRLRFTAEYADGLCDAEFVFLAVGTPTAADGQSADLRYLLGAAGDIARALPRKAIIVNKSTSPIGTGQSIARLMDDARPELAPWVVVSNPEFLREGCAVNDCLHPARVIVGAINDRDAAQVAALYNTLECPILTTDLNTAEMIKYASNAFLATRISFINEVSNICDRLNADVRLVAQGMGLDPRIGPDFLDAGLGYGGSCFPKDVSALTYMAARAGLHPQLLTAVTEINEDQRRWAVERLEERLGGLEGRTIAIWGLAFKANTDDLRESPALAIAQRLTAAGAMVRAYDPVAGEGAEQQGLSAVLCETPYDAVRGADAILLATDWAEFTAVDWHSVAVAMHGTLVFDGRNCLDAHHVTAAGLDYMGIGRPSIAAMRRQEAMIA